jgi:hypothetical protein
MTREFLRIASIARVGTWLELDLEIWHWIGNTSEPSHFAIKGYIHSFYRQKLLAVAALDSCVDVTEKIKGLVVEYGAEVEDEGSTGFGNSLLQQTVFQHKTEAAVALLELGADKDRVTGMWGPNMYVYAADENLVEIFVAMTRSRADLYQMNPFGENALVVSVRRGHLEIADFILKQGMNVDWCTNDDSMTLLHWAVDNRTTTSTAMINLLLNAGANPNLRSYRPAGYAMDAPGSGFTPLQYLLDTDVGVSRYTDFTEEQLVTVNANAKLIKDKMDKDVYQVRMAFCMVSQARLSSKPTCLLASLAVEPSIIRIIMDKVTDEFDINYPGNPLVPSVEYTGVWKGY